MATLRVRPGHPVRAIDGRLIGYVSALDAEGFQLKADAVTCWVRHDALFTAGDRGVTLICNVSGLKNYVYTPAALLRRHPPGSQA